MNHSGLKISKAARPNQYTWKMPSATAATAPHTASRASEGTSRRRIRPSTKLPPEPRSLDQSCRWAYPPTKKNTGMTCSSQVRIHRLRVKLRGAVRRRPGAVPDDDGEHPVLHHHHHHHHQQAERTAQVDELVPHR